jgi:hypothetical protein
MLKFDKFKQLREKLISEGAINESHQSFREYRELFEEAEFDAAVEEAIGNLEEDDIDYAGIAALEDLKVEEAGTAGEKIGNFFKNIIGFARLKSLNGKYTKALVGEAVAKMDFERKKDASDSKEETDRLRAAFDTKKSELSDRAKNIAQRMDDIATTEFLKNYAKKVKLQAKLKKNDIVIKIAGKEEARELKLRNAEITKDIQTADNELREYQKENAAKIKDAKKEVLAKTEEEIGKLGKKDSELRKNIGDKEADLGTAEGSDKAKIHGELANAQVERAKHLNNVIDKKETFNTVKGEEEYSTDKDESTAKNLIAAAEENTEKAKAESK